MSVLPVAGSELPADSDRVAVVCTALLDEAVDNTKEVVGLRVGQLCFRTDSEAVLPMMIDEHSMICDLVRPDSVPVDRDLVSNDVCGDDRFSPGVTERATLNRQTGLDSHGEVLWECLSVWEYSSVACLSDWRSVLQLVALMSGFPEFPDTGDPDFCLKMLISRVGFGDIGRNYIINFSDWKMCQRAGGPKFVCGWLLGHFLLFRFGRGGRFGRNLVAWRDFPARALRKWRNCAVARLRGWHGKVHWRGRVCRCGRLGQYKTSC